MSDDEENVFLLGGLKGTIRQQEAEIASLNQQLDAAVALLRRPERVTWGYDSDHRVLAYFLDGNYAGDTLRDVILAEATEGIKS